MSERSRRPIFARVYTRFAETSNRRGGADHRRKLLANLNGRVIELGAGSGANFEHYPASVDEVLAVEPEPYLRQQALTAATEAPANIRVLDGDAYRLPGDESTFDAGVASLVLCTFPTSSAPSPSCSESSDPVANCASTSTSLAIPSGRRAFNGLPTRPSGLTSLVDVTWRETRPPGSNRPGSPSRRVSASRSVPRRSSRPIRTSWGPHAAPQVLSPGDITEVSGPPGLPTRV